MIVNERVFDLDFQGQSKIQVIYVSYYKIFNIRNVQIDTKIRSVSWIQSELKKVTQWICVLLTLKVMCWGKVEQISYCEIPGLENVEIDTKIMYV